MEPQRPFDGGKVVGRQRTDACTEAVNLASVASVYVAVLVDRLGWLSDERMREICEALSVPLDCW